MGRSWVGWRDYIRSKSEGGCVQDDSAFQDWKTREPVLRYLCSLQTSLGDNFAFEYAPRLHIPTFKAPIPVHADGSIVDKHKGLAQIFDGVPWEIWERTLRVG